MIDTAVFRKAAEALPEECFDSPPAIGLILGSGWGEALEADRPICSLGYADIPGLGASTVIGHAGEMQLYMRHGIRIVAFLGRRHYYEGAGWEPVVMPVELMRRMGVRKLLVTNAAGGINHEFRPGTLMAIADHINTVGLNPLIGPLVEGWGTRFPDQSEVYSRRMIEMLRRSAAAHQADFRTGIYAYTAGPPFETPAEIRAYAGMGADAVGMSTVPETTVANACGFEIAGLSCITNMAAGISGPHLCHEEVLEESKKSRPLMAGVLDGFIAELAQDSQLAGGAAAGGAK